MAITLALDVYGTMINTSGVITTLEGLGWKPGRCAFASLA